MILTSHSTIVPKAKGLGLSSCIFCVALLKWCFWGVGFREKSSVFRVQVQGLELRVES